MDRYRDRRHAGIVLGEALDHYRSQDVLVLAVPRGGVEVAAPIAAQFGAELDVIVARKLGAPGNPELAIGAVGADGVPLLDERLISRLGVSEARLAFCTSRGGFTERVVPLNRFSRMYGRRVLETIDRAISTGLLPPSPREGACRWCDFRPVCGPHEETRARRKSREPLEDLVALRQLP